MKVNFLLKIACLSFSLICLMSPNSVGSQILIMPLGNSITYDNNSGDVRPIEDRIAYRLALYNHLDANWDSFDFIGSENAGEPTIPDGDNAGFPGITVTQLSTLISTGELDISPNTPPAITGRANMDMITPGPYFDTHGPDAILLHIGTNNVSVLEVPALEAILDEVDTYEANSGKVVPVFLALIIEENPVNATTALYNADVLAMANDRITNDGDEIIIVDMPTDAGLTALDMADQYHPNTAGYGKMADTWWAALDAYYEAADITTTTAPDATANVPYVLPVAATGTPSTLTYSLSGEPLGMSIDANSGEITWTPTEGDLGPNTFDVIAANDIGSDTQELTIIVAPAMTNQPTITGTVANQATNDDTSIDPFTGVTIADLDGDMLDVTISRDIVANGTFTNLGGFTFSGNDLVMTGTGAAVTTAIQGLTFVPTENQVAVGNTVTTVFNINVTDNDQPAVDDNTSSVIATSVNDLPTIVGTVASQGTNDNAPINPFTSVVIADADGETLDVSISRSVVGNGTWSNLGSFSVFGDDLIFNGTGAAATTDIQALTFTPTENQVTPGNTVTTTFTISVTDPNAGPVTDNTASVIATSINDAPVISLAGSITNLPVNDNATITPFTDVSFSDADLTPNLDITVTIQQNTQGSFTTLNGFSDDGGGVYTFSGTPAAATTAIAGMVFTPTENFASPTSITTTDLSIDASDGTDSDNDAGSVDATSINDNPTGANESVTVAESGNYTFGSGDFSSFTDIDTGDGLSSIRVTAINGSGTFTNNGGALNVNDVIDPIADLEFTPVAGANGNGYADFDFRLIDNFGGESIVYNMNIDVSAVNDPPVVTTSGGLASFTEDGPAVAVDAGITVTDPDDTNIESATVSISSGFVSGEDELLFTNQNGITGSYNSGTGVLTLSNSASVANYQTALRSIQYDNTNNDNPNEATRTISFEVNDGDLDSNTATRNVTVSGLNDDPTLAGTGGTLTYNEGDGDVAIDNALVVSDPDQENLVSATISISNNYEAAEDELQYTPQSGILVNSNAGGVLELVGSATVAQYQAALRTVRYENTSNSPVQNTRTISFVVNDGTTDSNTFDRSVNVVSVNSSPVVTVSVGNLSYQEGDGAVAIDPNITVTDADNANLQSASILINTNYDAADELIFTPQFGITETSNTGDEIVLTGNTSVANWQIVLRSIQFRNQSENINTASRGIRFRVNDGTSNSNNSTKTVNVTAINDVPAITVTGTTINYNEGNGAVVLDNGFTVTDLDDTNLEGASITIAPFQAGADVFNFTTQNGIGGSFAAGTLTLSGTATLAQYQTAIRSVTYENTSENPTPGLRTVTITVNDGDDDSNVDSRDINITAENDPPVVNTSVGNTVYNEGGPIFVVVDAAISVTDPDNTNLTGATVEFTGTYVNGEDELGFIQAGTGITGIWNAGTGILTLSGNHPVADYNTVLSAMTYINNAGANPTGGLRELTITVDDGALSASDIKNISVATNNTAPSYDFPITIAPVDEDDPNTVIDLSNHFSDDATAIGDLIFAIEDIEDPTLFSISFVGLDMIIDYADDAFGTSEVDLSCTDDEGAAIVITFSVTIDPVNDPPISNGIANVTVDEDAANVVIVLHNTVFSDVDDPLPTDLTYSVTANTPILFTSTDINAATGELTLVFAPDQFGVSSMTLTATDGDGETVNDSFVVTVNAINDEPMIDPIADQTGILEDAGEQDVNLTGINAGPNETQAITLDATTSTPALIENISIDYTSPETTAILHYTPVANAFGIGEIEVCVTDAGDDTPPPNDNQICQTFNVTIDPVNDEPTLDLIPNPSTIFVNSPEVCIPLEGIGPGPNESDNLIVFATSSNVGLIPNNPGSIYVNYNNPDATGEVCYTPQPDADGSTLIIVTVLDNGSPQQSHSESFTVNVSSVNLEPTIDPIDDITIDEDEATLPITFTGISPGAGENQQLDFVLSSSNTDLFDPADNDITLTGYDDMTGEALFNYTPKQDAFGVATITLTITDEGPGNAPNDNELVVVFTITVNAVNDPPTLDAIPNPPVYNVDEVTDPITLTGVSEGPANEDDGPLTFVITSSDQSVVDDADIVFDEMALELTYSLVSGASGETTITVTVIDGGSDVAPSQNSFSQSFDVIVSNEPDLVVTNVQLDKTDISRGEEVNLRFNLRNDGNSNVGQTTVTVLQSDDNMPDETDLVRDTWIVESIIANGMDSTHTRIFEVHPTTLQGPYHLIVCVDRQDQIDELNEDNNCSVFQFTVNNNDEPTLILDEPNLPTVFVVGDDEFLNYNVQVDDNGDLKPNNPVHFNYRGISSDKDFARMPARELGDNLFQYTLNASDFSDPIGIEYFFEVIDAGGLDDDTRTYHTYMRYEATEELQFEDLKYGAEVTDYQIISLPLELDNTSASGVFEDDFGSYNTDFWRLFRYQNGGVVENQSGLGEILPGQGFWFIARNQPEGGAPVDMGAGVTTRITRAQPFIISLKKGWNQIATPYNFNVSWTDVLNANQNINGIATEVQVYNAGFSNSDVLVAKSGAFVRSDTDVDVIVPVELDPSIQNARVTNNRTNMRRPGEWQLDFSLSTDKSTSSVSSLGMHQDASKAYDRYDGHSLPDFDFLGHAELKFEDPNYTESLTKDIRSVASDEVWTFTVKTAYEGNIHLTWNDLFDEIDGKSLKLYDINKGEIIDMLEMTSYTIDPNTSRSFKVYFGDPSYIDENLKPELVQLGQSYPNPFQSTTNIPFTLAKQNGAYKLQMNVFNMLGQKVKTLASGNYESGFYEVIWNGKDEYGAQQPSGVYIYKLDVTDAQGKTSTYHGRAILR